MTSVVFRYFSFFPPDQVVSMLFKTASMIDSSRFETEIPLPLPFHYLDFFLHILFMYILLLLFAFLYSGFCLSTVFISKGWNGRGLDCVSRGPFINHLGNLLATLVFMFFCCFFTTSNLGWPLPVIVGELRFYFCVHIFYNWTSVL